MKTSAVLLPARKGARLREHIPERSNVAKHVKDKPSHPLTVSDFEFSNFRNFLKEGSQQFSASPRAQSQTVYLRHRATYRDNTRIKKSFVVETKIATDCQG